MITALLITALAAFGLYVVGAGVGAGGFPFVLTATLVSFSGASVHLVAALIASLASVSAALWIVGLGLLLHVYPVLLQMRTHWRLQQLQGLSRARAATRCEPMTGLSPAPSNNQVVAWSVLPHSVGPLSRWPLVTVWMVRR